MVNDKQWQDNSDGWVKTMTESKERKKAIYQAIFWGITGIISLIMYIPPGLSVVQISSAIIVFFLIIYFAIRTLKYFRII